MTAAIAVRTARRKQGARPEVSWERQQRRVSRWEMRREASHQAAEPRDLPARSTKFYEKSTHSVRCSAKCHCEAMKTRSTIHREKGKIARMLFVTQHEVARVLSATQREA